jgi:parvulin-like peptidyl-prolyl isomerase
MERGGKKLAVRAVLFAGIIVTGGSIAVAAPKDDSGIVVIHTAAGDVTVADVRANLAALPPLSQIVLMRDVEQLRSFVRLIAAQKLMAEEASDNGWERKPEIKIALAAAVERTRTTVIVESYLQAKAEPAADYPSDEELSAAYEARKASYTTPKKFHYGEIVIALPKAADKKDEKKAARKLAGLEKALKAPDADFTAMAARFSADGTKKQSDAGIVAEERLPATVKPVLTALNPGDVSAPLRRDDGWHVYKLFDVTDAKNRSLEEVRNELRARLRQEKTDQNAKASIDDFLNKTPKPSDEALSRLTAQTAN